jgi:hypothetical protein
MALAPADRPLRPGPPAQQRGLGPLLALVAVTLLPVIGALVLYLHPEWVPADRVHHGVLVEPPAQLPDALLTTLAGEPYSISAWRGLWTLLLVRRDCGPDCRSDIETLTRIRLLLGADQDRLRRAVALLATAPGAASPDPEGALVFHATPSGPLAPGPGLYLLDPEVRVVLRYPLAFDPLGVLDDLKRLLRYSWVG